MAKPSPSHTFLISFFTKKFHFFYFGLCHLMPHYLCFSSSLCCIAFGTLLLDFGGQWLRLYLSLPSLFSRFLQVKTKLNSLSFYFILFLFFIWISLTLSVSLSHCLLKVLRSCSLPSNFQSIQSTTPLVTSIFNYSFNY